MNREPDGETNLEDLPQPLCQKGRRALKPPFVQLLSLCEMS